MNYTSKFKPHEKFIIIKSPLAEVSDHVYRTCNRISVLLDMNDWGCTRFKLVFLFLAGELKQSALTNRKRRHTSLIETIGNIETYDVTILPLARKS